MYGFYLCYGEKDCKRRAGEKKEKDKLSGRNDRDGSDF